MCEVRLMSNHSCQGRSMGDIPEGQPTIALALPSAASSAYLLRRELVELCARQAVDAEEAADFVLAVSEAFSNALKHGQLSPDDRIEVGLWVSGRAARVRLEYAGQPFEPGPATLPASSSTGGRGRFLMKELADRVEYRFDRGRTTVELRKEWRA
jgi:anti-sigma regulatory factor (Ser/Thr protein kinase)